MLVASQACAHVALLLAGAPAHPARAARSLSTWPGARRRARRIGRRPRTVGGARRAERRRRPAARAPRRPPGRPERRARRSSPRRPPPPGCRWAARHRSPPDPLPAIRRCPMRALALAAAVLLVFPAAASAHVEMSPDRVDPGSFTLFTVLSPDESEQPLTGLRLTVPERHGGRRRRGDARASRPSSCATRPTGSSRSAGREARSPPTTSASSASRRRSDPTRRRSTSSACRRSPTARPRCGRRRSSTSPRRPPAPASDNGTRGLAAAALGLAAVALAVSVRRRR